MPPSARASTRPPQGDLADPPAEPPVDPTADFEAFFARHQAGLARLAFLVTGDAETADDVAADALLAAWRQWDQVREADAPVAYVRRIVVNIGTSRVRRTIRERRVLPLLLGGHAAPLRDDAGVLDVRTALLALPARRRACVVLRYAFDLSEEEVARTLQISVGTVKSQTSKAAGQLRSILRAGGPGGGDERDGRLA